MRKCYIPVTHDEAVALIKESDPYQGVTFSIPSGYLVVDLDGPITQPMITLARMRGVEVKDLHRKTS